MQRRLTMLVTVMLLMTAMLAVTMAPALAVAGPPARTAEGPAWGVAVEPATACNTVAGVAGFEWRSGGAVSWLTLPVPPPEQ